MCLLLSNRLDCNSLVIFRISEHKDLSKSDMAWCVATLPCLQEDLREERAVLHAERKQLLEERAQLHKERAELRTKLVRVPTSQQAVLLVNAFTGLCSPESACVVLGSQTLNTITPAVNAADHCINFAAACSGGK